ncbi:MAG: phage integrase family protein [Clostridiales bacterium]|nr:phage integrase family protein [Clostridiales bacterium]
MFSIVEKFYQQGKKKILEMHEKVFYNTYCATLRRAGIRLPPHCCWQAVATALANAGIPPAVIIVIFGHEDYTATFANFTHIKIDETLSVANKI